MDWFWWIFKRNVIISRKKLKIERKMYKYKEKTYKILHFSKSKSRKSRVWYNSIVYEQIESGLVFTREEKDFYSKFEKVWVKIKTFGFMI